MFDRSPKRDCARIASKFDTGIRVIGTPARTSVPWARPRICIQVSVDCQAESLKLFSLPVPIGQSPSRWPGRLGLNIRRARSSHVNQWLESPRWSGCDERFFKLHWAARRNPSLSRGLGTEGGISTRSRPRRGWSGPRTRLEVGSSYSESATQPCSWRWSA